MKKILFVTYDFPYPTNTGGKNRSYHMLKYAGSGIKKYLFSFVREDFKKDYEKETDKLGVEVVGIKKRRQVWDPRNIFGLLRQDSIFKTLYFSKATLLEICSIIQRRKIDIVLFESFYTAFYISDVIRNMGVKQIFGTENIEFKVYKDYVDKVNSLLKPFYAFQTEKIKKEEIGLFKKADLCITVSERDAKVIREYAKKCEIVKNGVDLDEFKFEAPKKKHGKNLLFVGSFSYFPNVDGINYFYNSVFKKLGDDISLTIVGKKVKTLPFVDDPRIIGKEFVPNIANEYENSDLVVSPLRLGGGTNFKVLEAMAKGVPVISLPHRLEGLDIEYGKDIIVVYNDDEFLDRIKMLLNDFDLRKRISKEARELVEREYSWEKIGKSVEDIWDSL